MTDLIKSIDEAVIHVKEEFKKRGVGIDYTNFINDRKHCILITDSGTAYYILYKRDFFRSFGHIFKEQGQSGVGESINESFLALAKFRNITSFLVVYEDGKVYSVTPQEWFDFAKKNNTIRTTESAERTFSIPVGMLRRWDRDAE
jgi:hypothetical protein